MAAGPHGGSAPGEVEGWMRRMFVVGLVVAVAVTGFFTSAARAANVEADCLGPLPPRFLDRAPMDSQYAAELRAQRDVQTYLNDPDRLDAWLAELRRTRPRMPDGTSLLGVVAEAVNSNLIKKGDALAELVRTHPLAPHYRLALEILQHLEGCWNQPREKTALQLRACLTWLETEKMGEAEASGDPQAFTLGMWICSRGSLPLPDHLRILRRGVAQDPANPWLTLYPLTEALGRPEQEEWLTAVRESVSATTYEDILARVALRCAGGHGWFSLGSPPKVPWDRICAGLHRVLRNRALGGETLVSALCCAGMGGDLPLATALMARIDLTGHPTYGGRAPAVAAPLVRWARGNGPLAASWWQLAARPVDRGPLSYERSPLAPGVTVPPAPTDPRSAWAHHVVVGDYVSFGLHDGRWDQEALAVLAGWARLLGTSLFADAALTHRVAQGADALVAGGCQDPLIRLVHLVLGREMLTVPDERYFKGIETVACDLAASPYGAEVKAAAEHLAAEAADLSHAVDPLGLESPHERSLRHRNQEAEHLRTCLKNPSTPPWRALQLAQELRKLNAASELGFPLQDRPPGEGLVEAIDGLTATDLALSARGQPDMVRFYVEGAEERLRAAWEANPTLPEVARALVTVTHLAGKSREEVTAWFDRARALAPRAEETYRDMLATLLPRTADDEGPLLDFIDQVVAWQGELHEPCLLDTVITAHRWIAEGRIRRRRLRPEPGQERADLIAAAGPWREERVQAQVKQGFAATLACTAGTASERALRTRACVQALMLGDMPLARRQAASIEGRLDESVEFWRWARDKLQAAPVEPPPPPPSWTSWFGLSLDGGR